MSPAGSRRASPSTVLRNGEKILIDHEYRKMEAGYSSLGINAHPVQRPKIFQSCEGSLLYDTEGNPYLDLQMAAATASFGYQNKRLNQTLKEQLDRLPQSGSHYLNS